MVLKKKATETAGNKTAAKKNEAVSETTQAAAGNEVKAAKETGAKAKANGPVKTNSSSKTQAKNISSTDIERRAFEIWQAKGCPIGQDVEIWLEAEEDLKSL